MHKNKRTLTIGTRHKNTLKIFALALLLAALMLCGCRRSGGTHASEPASADSSTASVTSTEVSGTEAPGSFSPGTDAPGEKRILVIETTDLHGHLFDASSGNQETFTYNLAYIAAAIDAERASGKYDDVLLLDGGDIYQGTPISTLTGGASMRAAMDSMDYDAVALGNHEFDWEVTEYAADAHGTIAPYVLGDRFGDPDTPVLAANLYDKATGLRVPFTQDYCIAEKAGLRIAVIGYIPDYRADIMAEKIAPYRIDGGYGKLQKLVREVNAKEHPDATIILAHDKPQGIANYLDPAETVLVAGGHTHKAAEGRADNGIHFMQGDHNGAGYGAAELVFEADGSVRVEDVRFVSVTENKTLLYDTPENAPHLDPEIMDLSRTAWEAVQDEMSEVLGYIDTSIVKTDDPGSNVAGNWFTGLMLRATRDQGAVAAFYNNGGIRKSFKIPKGQLRRNITVYDIYTFAPFGNSLLVYEITGPELARQLADGLRDSDYGDQMSGISFTYTATGDKDTNRKDREYTILSITLDDGTEVDMEDENTIYRVCTSNYSATRPGSVFEGKIPVVPEADAPIDNESMIAILCQEGLENDGRLAVDVRVRGVEE